MLNDNDTSGTAYDALIQARDPITREIAARLGHQDAQRRLQTMLTSKNLRLLDSDSGRRIVTDKEYTLNDEILSAARFRGTSFLPSPSKDHIEAAISKLKFPPTDEQQEAIDAIFINRLTIIKGGPGSGKSTILPVITNALRGDGLKAVCAIAAFSARIAVRTANLCGVPGYTLHALTGTRPGSETYRGEAIDQGLQALIIDEAFSVDTSMLARIFRHTSWNTRLILVGDPGQMLPIEGGRTLHDLAELGAVPTITFKTSHRLSSGSGGHPSHLQTQADRLLQGHVPTPGPGLIIHRTSADDYDTAPIKAAAAVRLLKGSIDNGFSCIILTTTKFGDCGHVAINRLIAGTKYPFTGHEIITTAAHPKKLWRNGERGTVGYANETVMEIHFDNGSVVTTPRSNPDVSFGYAISGHRGQGLEYDRVIVLLDPTGSKLLSRQYLRSTMTRAPKCIIIADPGLIELAARRDDLQIRTPVLQNIGTATN